MTEKLIGALAQSIRENLGKGYRVYTENVNQYLEKPCFFVECESAEKVPLLGRRFFLRLWVKITFEAEDDRKNYQEQLVLGDLFLALNTLPVGDLCLTGRKIHTKKESGRMVVRGCYDIFFEQIGGEKAELMESTEGGFTIDE